MPVCCHAICLNIFIDLAEKVRQLGAPSCSGGSGFGVNNQAVHIDQPLFCQRISCQDGTGCITTRICHKAGCFHFFPVDLAQTIHRFIKKLRRFVLNLIPFFINRYVFEPEIRAQINHLRL